MIDTHAHLDALGKDMKDVMNRARESGVQAVVTVGTCAETSREAAAIAAENYDVYAAAGIHPHDADASGEKELNEISRLAGDENVVALGEMGLDFIKKYSSEENQRRVFSAQLKMAIKKDLPVIIHSRGAEKAVCEILEKDFKGIRGQVHCYTGPVEQAMKFVEMGLYVSFTGVVTYPNAKDVMDVAREVPIEKQLLETDLPYMAPVPKRGKRNEPAFLKYVVDFLADLKGLSPEDVVRITSQNAKDLFSIGSSKKKAPLAYPIRDSLYVNLTSGCSNECSFCPRSDNWTVKGHYLYLEKDPAAEEVIAEAGDVSGYKEVCFCGFGEPTRRLEALKKVARFMKNNGVRVRVNTNGQGFLINGRDILPELYGLVDEFSVSLNAENSQEYQKICRSEFGAKAFEAVCDFIKGAASLGFDVTATAVALPSKDLAPVKSLAEKLGASFRKREYKEIG